MPPPAALSVDVDGGVICTCMYLRNAPRGRVKSRSRGSGSGREGGGVEGSGRLRACRAELTTGGGWGGWGGGGHALRRRGRARNQKRKDLMQCPFENGVYSVCACEYAVGGCGKILGNGSLASEGADGRRPQIG